MMPEKLNLENFENICTENLFNFHQLLNFEAALCVCCKWGSKVT